MGQGFPVVCAPKSSESTLSILQTEEETNFQPHQADEMETTYFEFGLYTCKNTIDILIPNRPQNQAGTITSANCLSSPVGKEGDLRLCRLPFTLSHIPGIQQQLPH